MVKFVRAKMNQISNQALAVLFADSKEEAEAIKGDTSKIYGWPMKYTIEEGSIVRIPNGSIGTFDSEGNVAGWASSGGGGGDIGPDNPTPYIDLDQDGIMDTTASNNEVNDYVDSLWNNGTTEAGAAEGSDTGDGPEL